MLRWNDEIVAHRQVAGKALTSSCLFRHLRHKVLEHNLTMASYLGAALDTRLGGHVKLRSSDSILSLHCDRRGRRVGTLRPRASSTSSGMQRQHQKGSFVLRHNGPSLRGFSGDSSSCSTRCSALYAAALQLARSQVWMVKRHLESFQKPKNMTHHFRYNGPSSCT